LHTGERKQLDLVLAKSSVMNRHIGWDLFACFIEQERSRTGRVGQEQTGMIKGRQNRRQITGNSQGWQITLTDQDTKHRSGTGSRGS